MEARYNVYFAGQLLEGQDPGVHICPGRGALCLTPTPSIPISAVLSFRKYETTDLWSMIDRRSGEGIVL